MYLMVTVHVYEAYRDKAIVVFCLPFESELQKAGLFLTTPKTNTLNNIYKTIPANSSLKH